MARVRYLSRNRKLGSVDRQRAATGKCDAEIEGDLLDASPIELRSGDVLAVSHARGLGKYHQRERCMAFLAGRDVMVSIGTADPIDVAASSGRARLHELAKLPTGEPSIKQQRLPGAPRRYREAEGDQLEMARKWWAGPLHTDEVLELYGDMMKCATPSRPWLVALLGKRPAHPNRTRRPRSDKGVKKS